MLANIKFGEHSSLYVISQLIFFRGREIIHGEDEIFPKVSSKVLSNSFQKFVSSKFHNCNTTVNL